MELESTPTPEVEPKVELTERQEALFEEVPELVLEEMLPEVLEEVEELPEGIADLTLGELEVLKWRCKEDFETFASTIQDPEWHDEIFHGRLCRFLQYGTEELAIAPAKEGKTRNLSQGHRRALAEKQAKDRIVVMPRSHLKTTYAAGFYPLWMAAREPSLRICIVSNSQENGCKKVHFIRGLVEGSAIFRILFPEVIPNFNKVRWTDSCACLARPQEFPEGTFEAAGVGTNIIGRHYDRIIEDDTVAPTKDEMGGDEMMPSQDEIEKAVGWHKVSLPLLVDIDFSQRIFIATRWASYDAISYIKEHEIFGEHAGGRYVMLDMPALLPDGTNAYKRFSVSALESIKASMGSYMFSALYLNEPLSEENMKFRPSWIRYYEDKELPKDGQTKVTVDPADPPTGKSSQDSCAIVSCKHTVDGLFVRRVRRGHFTLASIIEQAFDVAEEDEASEIGVEGNSYAHLVAAFKIESAKRAREGRFTCRVVELKTRGRQKEARIMRLQPVAENGLLWLKREMNDLENELFKFPYGVHDDIIDALAWQVNERFKVDRSRVTIPEVRAVGIGFSDILDSFREEGNTRSLPFDIQLSGGLEAPSLERWYSKEGALN